MMLKDCSESLAQVTSSLPPSEGGEEPMDTSKTPGAVRAKQVGSLLQGDEKTSSGGWGSLRMMRWYTQDSHALCALQLTKAFVVETFCTLRVLSSGCALMLNKISYE